jgi:hypothetical protein
VSKTIAIDLMESKINRIINIIRQLKEESAIVNSVGNGGLTNASTPPGRLDGYDKVMGKMQRRKIIGKGKFPGARTRWKNTNNSN